MSSTPNEEPFDLSSVPLDIFTELNLMFAPCGASKGGIDSVESHLNLLEEEGKITTEAKRALLECFRSRAMISPHEFKESKDSVVAAHIANLRNSIPVGDFPKFSDVEDLISSRLFPNDASRPFFAIPALKLLATLQMRTSLSKQEVLDILGGPPPEGPPIFRASNPSRSEMAEGLLEMLGFYLVCDNDGKGNDEYRLSYNGRIVIETLTAAERIQAVMRVRFEKWLKQLTPSDALRDAASYIEILARM